MTTLKRILSKKLKTFLRESFSGSTIINDVDLEMIRALMVKALHRPFSLNVFTMTTNATPEDILYYCEQYYFERDWLKQSERIVNIQHNGMDLSFERDDGRLFLILSPFEKFIKITIVKFKITKNKGKQNDSEI